MKELKKELKRIIIVFRYTFLEIYKSKVLLNVLFLGFGLAAISYLAYELSYGHPEKISMDIGLGATFFSLFGIAIFLGSNIISTEIESRTIYLILSKPIKRTSFLIGKLGGMSAILFINMLILGIFTCGIFIFLGGKLNSLIILSLIMDYCSALIALNFVVFFSMITNNILSVIFTITVFLVGNTLSSLVLMDFVSRRPILLGFIKLIRWIFPNLEMLNLKEYVIYQNSLPLSLILGALLYGILYSFFIFMITAYIFEQKNLD